MSGFRLRQPHLHPLYRRQADADCVPGCLVAIDKSGKLVLATAEKPIVGLCWDKPADAPLVTGAAYYRALGDGEFIVDKPDLSKPELAKPKEKRLAENPTWARLSKDCDDVEPVGAGEADFLVVDDLDGMWVVQVLARRRLT